MPYKLWTVGEEVLAADFNAFVQEQCVATFPNAAARTAAISSPPEGMLTYLEDLNRYETWNGTAWMQQLTGVIDNGGTSRAVRIRTGSTVDTTNSNGDIAMNFSPPLGTVLTVLANTRDVFQMIVMPYRSQFIPGAITVTWNFRNMAGAVIPNTTLGWDWLIMDTP